ncbi:hypothetical protein [Paenibacillus sp. GXUN7292]|uniref:hypothetical protein n=1 Tax=Paenibacillus sp. GXUN7292 TaxID=3422499 RepID=UPI003D7EDF50
MKKNKKILLTGAAFLFTAIVVLVGFLLRNSTDQNIILTINHHKVTIDEFNVFLQDSKALTISHFQNKYNAEYNKDFWQTSFQGETPIEHLKNKALNKLKEYKVEQIMMLEEGVVEDISHQHFLKALEEENLLRQQKLNSNEPIYGPRQYQTVEYFQYSHTLNRQRLIDKLVLAARDEHTEEFFESYYEKIKARYFKKRKRFDYEQIVVHKTEDSEQQFDKLLYLTSKEPLSTEEAIKRVDLEATIEQKHLDMALISRDDVWNSFLFESFLELKTGEFMELLPEYEQHDLTYRLTHIYDDGYEKYEDVKNGIPQYYIQELLEQRLRESINQAEVVIHERAFNNIRMN